MAGTVKVLLIDDNPMILGMLSQALGKFAELETTTDSAEGLLKIVEAPPDLLITDYQMPGMDGRQLVEKLKDRAATARLPIILMATKADQNEKLKVVEDKIEDFLEKPFFVKEATARIKRIIDRIALEKMAREAPGDGTLRGSLQQMNVIDLLQSLELSRKTCRLTLTSGDDRCQLFFTEGQINHGVYGALSGDEAVYKVLTWQDGNFQIDFTSSSTEQTITRSTQGLLMEGLRLLDEANRDASEDNVLDA
jgi:DNA-binding response OmpR family regulator